MKIVKHIAYTVAFFSLSFIKKKFYKYRNNLSFAFLMVEIKLDLVDFGSNLIIKNDEKLLLTNYIVT
jgi:hypothetical protein